MKVNLDSFREMMERQVADPEPQSETRRATVAAWIGKKMKESGYRDLNPKFHHEFLDYLVRFCDKKPMRGLMLVGGVGTGKTMAAAFMAALYDIEFFTANELVAAYPKHRDDFHGWLKSKRSCGNDPYMLAIDDLGAEPTVVDYGMRFELLGQVLAARYDDWRYSGHKTILTTNLEAKEIVARYGARLESRMHEMFEIIPVLGQDLRKIKS